MKIQLTQLNVTTTIEIEEEGQTTYEMAQFFREILLAQGYHPPSVSDAMPDEHDIEEIVGNAIDGVLYGDEDSDDCKGCGVW